MTLRWSTKDRMKVERPEIDAFLKEIAEVCVRHGLSISHEDGHGAFLIENVGEGYMDWLNDAHDNRE
jgi:hypothetical protein